MTVTEIVIWVGALLLTGAVGALAVVAGGRDREWFALPSLIPPVLVLAAGALGDRSDPAAFFPVALSLLIAAIGVVAGNPLVTLVLSLSSAGGDTRLGAHGGILVRDRTSPLPERMRAEGMLPDREILRGGTMIGYLERFALIGSVVVGQSAAVALIVAVKGLGRFSELENERARERFIIGTLASLIWAGVCAVAILTLR